MQCLLSKAGRRYGVTLSLQGRAEEAAFFRFEAEIPVRSGLKGPFLCTSRGKGAYRGWISVIDDALLWQIAPESHRLKL
ncbi:hypothetical protein CF134_09805 [Aeromonas salmonicida]|nr:hypothetical protein CF134_09805 [Aeromonas salmonicida]